MTGSVTPRLWTPPLRDLSDPDSTYGYELIEFADAIGWPLDPWQRWAAIHMGELTEEGLPRFRVVLILVARQNGKTLLCRILILYWMFVDRHEWILGTHTDRQQAKKSWRKVVEMARGIEVLQREMPRVHTRETIGEEDFFNDHGAHYFFRAPGRNAGRGDTLPRILLDELREHADWETYDAALHAMRAVDDAQCVAITNQGDARSVVLDQLREDALSFIETGLGDPTTGLFEWSAPRGARPDDPAAIAAANPNVGHRIKLQPLINDAGKAMRLGGQALASFKTEALCMRVLSLNAAIDDAAWEACGTDTPLDLAAHRQHVVLCLDVSLDGLHAAVVAGALVDGVVHVEIVAAWAGAGCTRLLRTELPDIAERIRPRRIGWFPGGPAAAVAASVRAKPGKRSWAPRRCEVAELVEEVPAVCMGLAELVGPPDAPADQPRQLQHPNDLTMTTQVTGAEKLPRGDRWVFTRQGAGPVNIAYAVAGAAHLARTLPPPAPPLAVA